MTRSLADAVRVAGALSFVAVTPRGGVATALMALVLLGLTLLRVVGVPPAMDLATGALLVAAAWFALSGAYERYAGLDSVVHLAATGLVAVAAHRALVAARVLPPRDDPRLLRPGEGAVIAIVCLGLAMATLWEMGEWLGHTYLDPAIRTGYDDTIGDLASGGLGALLAGLLSLRRSPRARRPAEPAVPSEPSGHATPSLSGTRHG